MIEVILIILIALLCASGWLAYAFTIRLIGQRDIERDRYKRALELAEARASERIMIAEREFTEQHEQAFAQGKQDGKRATLDWIKRQVDDGTLSIKVVGSPKQ